MATLPSSLPLVTLLLLSGLTPVDVIPVSVSLLTTQLTQFIVN